MKLTDQGQSSCWTILALIVVALATLFCEQIATFILGG